MDVDNPSVDRVSEIEIPPKDQSEKKLENAAKQDVSPPLEPHETVEKKDALDKSPVKVVPAELVTEEKSKSSDDADDLLEKLEAVVSDSSALSGQSVVDSMKENVENDDLLERLEEIESGQSPKAVIDVDKQSEESDDLLKRLEEAAASEPVLPITNKKLSSVEKHNEPDAMDEDLLFETSVVKESSGCVKRRLSDETSSDQDAKKIHLELLNTDEDIAEISTVPVPEIANKAEVVISESPPMQQLKSDEAKDPEPTDVIVAIEDKNEIVTKSIIASPCKKALLDTSATMSKTSIVNSPIVETEVAKISEVKHSPKRNESEENIITLSDSDAEDNRLQAQVTVEMTEEYMDNLMKKKDMGVEKEQLRKVKETDEQIQRNSSELTESVNSSTEDLIIRLGKEEEISDKDITDQKLADAKKAFQKQINAVSATSTNKKPAEKEPVKMITVPRIAHVLNNGSSTPKSNNTSATAGPVFNSTPIRKPFEMSSENVSKISDDGKEKDKYLESSDCGTSSDQPSDDTKINEFVKVIQQSNGLAAAQLSSENSDFSLEIIRTSNRTNTNAGGSMSMGIGIEKQQPRIVGQSLANGSSCVNLDSSVEIVPDDNSYEISIWNEENDMKCFLIEKVDSKGRKLGRHTPLSDLVGTDSSGKSSNGSVSSFGPFPLPGSHRLSMSASSSSGPKFSDGKFAIPAPPIKTKKTMRGMFALCNFMIDYFTKIRNSLPHADQEMAMSSCENSPSMEMNISCGRDTPKLQRSNKDKVVKHLANVMGSPEVVQQINDSAGNKRKISKVTRKSPKARPGSPLAMTVATTVNTDDFVDGDKVGCSALARWIDRKYYAGKVVEAKGGGKFAILFADGATKTLPHFSIVFGQNDVLPLQNQSVHVRVDGDNYEPGLIISIKRNSVGKIIYEAVTDSTVVTVTGTDIYLTDEQAKDIQRASSVSSLVPEELQVNVPKVTVKDASIATVTTNLERSTRPKRGEKVLASIAITPEPGFSGNLGKRSKRSKRLPQQASISESSDVSDTMESDSGPNSPDSALEAVDGVQPELQKTPKETQINKMCLIAEYCGNDQSKNIEEVLGPLPNKTLFKNKHFILTCTLPIKAIAGASAKKSDKSAEMSDRAKKFTTLPFIKEHLKRQLEAGGGKVYNHFEDIPKNKYKQCKVIAPHPCITAKYVQCLAADISAISHEWVIESCRKNSLVEAKQYTLPSGWSIIEERYMRWAVGRQSDQRSNVLPFSSVTVMVASENKIFEEFWTRVCKLAGATIRIIKSLTDITQGLTGYMLTDDEFSQEIKSKAEHFGLPIVSTVWVVQTLIIGKVCQPDAHAKLTQIYQDDDY